MKRNVENSELDGTEVNTTTEADTDIKSESETETNLETIALIEQVHIDLQTTNVLILVEICFLCVFIGFYLARLVWNRFLG